VGRTAECYRRDEVLLGVLRKSAGHISDELEKFRHEVDKAIGTDTNKRGDTEVAFGAKADTLDEVEKLWSRGQYDYAVVVLEDAERMLRVGQNGLSCIQKSIEKKETQCDPKTLQPKQ
jgi:hypothetical protein